MQISHQDLRKVLDAVEILMADYDPYTLPNRTSDSVKCLVATDILSFEGFGTDNDYQGPLWYTPEGMIPMERLGLMTELIQGHPCFRDVAERRIQDAVRVSDYVSLVEFKRTAIYNEFFRFLGTDRQLLAGLPVTSELMISVSLCRLQKDFTERDCSVFDLLTPHLTSAFRNAQFIKRLKFEAEQMEVALEATKFGVVTIDSAFRTQIESPTAIRLFRKYFKCESERLPTELNRYVRYHLPRFLGDEFYLPPIPLEIAFDNTKLIIRLTYHSRTKTTVLLLEEIVLPSANNFVGLRLTQREASVLFWISQGKTDSEIGRLLEISIRTVQKHIQNIFDKLGVETRTAAMARFLER